MTDYSAEQFLTTRWSVVLAAGRGTPARARKALAELCQTYWYPLYAYVRRRGHGPQDAEDLTQGFLARLLEKHAIAQARHERGRFRSFLLASMNHYLSDEWDKARAQKRGGERVISLDAMSAESRYAMEPQDQLTPERVFERQWALRLLAEVLRRLEAEYAAEGKAEQFEHLRSCLTGQRRDLPYAELARRMQTSEGAMKVAAHRLRQRYRALLREEIAQTVASEDEVEEELRTLHLALAG
ncbi:MAG: sigma-70 family RNA polymerase sigma factor [Tepidisphaeraceae bacterium]|jgi:RNA polymerase sigma-70 factor (ECF subfamily)